MNELEVLKMKLSEDLNASFSNAAQPKVVYSIVTVHEGVHPLALDIIMKDLASVVVHVSEHRVVQVALVGTGKATGHHDHYD